MRMMGWTGPTISWTLLPHTMQAVYVRVVASTQSFKYQYKYQYLSLKYQYQYPCLKYKYKYQYFSCKYQYQYKYLKMVLVEHMFFSHSLTPPYLLFTESNNT